MAVIKASKLVIFEADWKVLSAELRVSFFPPAPSTQPPSLFSLGRFFTASTTKIIFLQSLR
ncbi:hypothetical protein A2T98_22175 [Nodularia spumigena CENA596]|uniref:Uncharacterized protein n=1 Tax=Nodularia spumigena CENA596 TaxID=1819295 RepID=A0A161VLP7_NODSP|nr:hypothetical protein A2T98_22175 [Nodularia spumigena CENA596]